jgi:hypothetical protein
MINAKRKSGLSRTRGKVRCESGGIHTVAARYPFKTGRPPELLLQCLVYWDYKHDMGLTNNPNLIWKP